MSTIIFLAALALMGIGLLTVIIMSMVVAVNMAQVAQDLINKNRGS